MLVVKDIRALIYTLVICCVREEWKYQRPMRRVIVVVKQEQEWEGPVENKAWLRAA